MQIISKFDTGLEAGGGDYIDPWDLTGGYIVVIETKRGKVDFAGRERQTKYRFRILVQSQHLRGVIKWIIRTPSAPLVFIFIGSEK